MIEGHVGRGDSVSKESESVKGVKNSQLISTTCGSMLGIWVDTMKWIWYVSEEKVPRHYNDLNDMLGMETGASHAHKR